jgi:endonuclease/exonuclease/phosphatase family metal-dependent hydrolase
MLGRIFLCAGLTCAALVAAAPAASAATVTITNIGSNDAEVTVDPAAATLSVYDNAADGHSAVAVYWDNDSAVPAYLWNTAGAGGAPAKAVLHGSSVRFRACLGESGVDQVLWDTCRGKETTVRLSAPMSAAPAATSVAPPRSGEVQQLTDQPRVMTWNMGTGAGFDDLDGWANTIAAYAPDVLGVQEMCVTDMQGVLSRLRAKGLNYQASYATWQNKLYCNEPTGGAFGEAILSLRPISAETHATYVNQSTDSTADVRGWQALTITIDGQPVRVFNTHLEQPGGADHPLNTAARDAQARELAEISKTAPRAIGFGDLNSTPENGEGADSGLTTSPSTQPAPMPFYNAGFSDLDRDCTRFTNPENVSATIIPECTLTQPSSSGGPDHKFDYVFVRLLVAVDEPSSLPTAFSDHQPYFGRVGLTPNWSSNDPLYDFGATNSKAEFNQATHVLKVTDNNEDGLSAAVVYWQWGQSWNKRYLIDPDGVGTSKTVQLGMAAGDSLVYMSCSAYNGGADGPARIFWDTCGDQRFNLAS